MSDSQTVVQHTPLHPEHEALGASFTDFGGWQMPLKYGSELAEHRSVRGAAGLFDLSHMGEIRVSGPDAATFLNTALVGNLAVMAVGRAKYSVMCNAEGGIIDDLISYRLADDEYLVVPNAANAATVFTEFEARARGFDVKLADETLSTALIAIQGPRSADILHTLVDEADLKTVRDMKYYAAVHARVLGKETLVARTGYTGEDGFEVYVPNEQAVDLWRALLDAGEPLGLIAAGLAARDSLRLEAGMPLYGNELGVDTTPYEAGLGGIVSFKKAEQFVGRAALQGLREQSPARVLVGLSGSGRRAGRGGYAVSVNGEPVGEITSGQPSPTLGHPIALAYIAPEHAAMGTPVEVDLRGKPEPFEVVALPFYKRGA